MYSVVVVEDETLTRRAIALSLREAGFTVHEASDALACRALLRQTRPDMIVLDLGLPGIDGMDFARELRVRSDFGLIIVTRQSAPEARIASLDLGADDYLIKPIHYGELAARIRSVMRRLGRDRSRRRKVGQWTVDLEARTVSNGRLDASLTRGEFDILARLIQADTKIVTRQELLSAISRSPQESDMRSVDALVSRLRRKLGETTGGNLIATAPGFGYRLAATPETEEP
ncbi:MAG: response regulator transcription factor [Proteobacteria bacterium]|nr:response regulator transcription factor [Pseudomonadota bacterium]